MKVSLVVAVWLFVSHQLPGWQPLSQEIFRVPVRAQYFQQEMHWALCDCSTIRKYSSPEALVLPVPVSFQSLSCSLQISLCVLWRLHLKNHIEHLITIIWCNVIWLGASWGNCNVSWNLSIGPCIHAIWALWDYPHIHFHKWGDLHMVRSYINKIPLFLFIYSSSSGEARDK